MRVINPREFDKIKPVRQRPPVRTMALLSLLVIFAIGGWYILSNDKQSLVDESSNESSQSNHSKPAEKPKTESSELKQFSGEEFKKLARNLQYPNLKLLDRPPSITGYEQADKIIIEIAESRGYELSSVPVSPIKKIDEPRLDRDDLLQPLAASSWIKLKTAATNDNIPLALLSGYRSLNYQKALFMSRLTASGATVNSIINRRADSLIVKTLEITAPPGYSRHHNGYTIDLWCEDGSGHFTNSKCYEWISADNYKIAKQNGWIPSYPKGAKLQGPEPESWEYVWVDQSFLY